jgi:hypothetical protein
VIGVAVEERAEDVREWVAGVEFPVLLDRDHLLADRLDIRNVPTVAWFDEQDRMVRPNDVAFGSDLFIDFHGIDSTPHHEALARWVREGVVELDDAGVRAHQVTPDDDEQLARLHWRLAAELLRRDRAEAARQHLDEATRLAPLDFTIRRGSMPLLGIDPFLSDEFIALWGEYEQAGKPGYGFEH